MAGGRHIVRRSPRCRGSQLQTPWNGRPDTLFFIDPLYDGEWTLWDGIPAAQITAVVRKLKRQYIVAYTDSAAAGRAFANLGHMKEGGVKQPVTGLERPAVETARARPTVRTRASVMMSETNALRLLIDGIDGGCHRNCPIAPGYGDIVAAAGGTNVDEYQTDTVRHARDRVVG